MSVALVMKHIVNPAKEEQGNSVFAVHFTVKGVYPIVHYQQDVAFQKIGMPSSSEAFKRRVSYSVTLTFKKVIKL